MNKFISAIGGSAYGGKNKKGFSFLELMVVLSIISIMTVVAIVSFQSKRVGTDLESSALEVTAAIREAQNNALTGKKPDPNFVPCDYIFQKKDGSDSQYEIVYHYRDGAGVCTTGTATNNYATYSLKNRVIFKNFSSAITFNIPFGNTSSETTIELSKDNNPYFICVALSGGVSGGSTSSCLQN
jgi:prepilin-type N-terminal cleavage/methylation domain-containing protein